MTTSAILVNYAAVLALSLFAVALVSDLATMTIGNNLIVALLALYLLAAPFSVYRWDQIAFTLGASFCVLAAGLIVFARGWVGGGDVKLAAAAVLWVGAEQTLDYFVHASIFGGLLTLVLLAFRRMPLPPQALRAAWIARLHAAGGKVPYGVALAIAAAFLMPTTRWFSSPT